MARLQQVAVAPPPAEMARALEPLLRAFVGRVVSGARLFNGPLAITSWWRSAERNASVGGSPDSQHLLGIALDLVVTPGSERRAVAAFAAAGLRAIDEGDHVHLQLLPAGLARSSGLLAVFGL